MSGTADAVRFEKATGLSVGEGQAGGHITKAQNDLRRLSKLVNSDTLKETDRATASRVAKDLSSALSGN